MLIPLMVALIPKLFCSQRLAGYVTGKVEGIWETVCGSRKPFADFLIILQLILFSARFEDFWETPRGSQKPFAGSENPANRLRPVPLEC